MHRSHILNLLEDYLQRFPGESRMCERMSRFVEQNPRCFERSLAIGHITGSCWLVDRSGQRVLLTHHRKLNRWLQLGGHADGDPDVQQVAMNEAREESGISDLQLWSPFLFDIDIHLIPAHRAEPAHFHYDCRFVLQAIADETFRVSEESHDLQWIFIDQLEDVTT